MINSRRREERIAVRLDVRVWGMDANGKPFSQNTSTLDVTRTGARLSGPACPLRPGDIIGLQHGGEKARFRVAWVGKPETVRKGQIGVVSLEPNKYIWGTPLSELKAAAPPPERPPLGASFAQPQRPATDLIPSIAPKGSERRDAIRYACTGGAEFRNIAGGFKNWGTVSDVSENGCYVETVFPLPARTGLDLLISVRNIDIRGRAQVRSSHPNVGMGIEFTDISPEDKQRLDSLISMLSIVPGAVQRPAQAKDPLGPVIATPVAEPVAAIEKEPSLSDPIYRVCTELRDAEALLEANSVHVEPKAIGELVRALDRARQTAEAVQKWIENQGDKSSYDLIAAREAARVRTVTALARELVVDVDASLLDLGSEGFEGLLNAISQLHSRLVTLVEKGRREQDEPLSAAKPASDPQ